MKIATIRQLNRLTEQFYQQTATEFSQTRQQPWQGWVQLRPLIKKLIIHNTLTVLDVGCGNGRFGQFLYESFPQVKIEYTGIDNSPQLLAIAQQQLTGAAIPPTLLQVDLIENLLSQKYQLHQQYQLVTLFGVMHHVPSAELRMKVIQRCQELLTDEGTLVFTLWQFMNHRRWHNRLVPPEKIGLDAADLEPGDYFLDWQRGTVAYRYCHQLSEDELQSIMTKTRLTVIDQFEADGKTNQVNRYIVCQKSSIPEV